MLIRTIWKLPVIILLLENSQKVFAQSLFDDLPQNGALSPDIQSRQNTVSSDTQSKSKILKPKSYTSTVNENLRNIRLSTTTTPRPVHVPTEKLKKISKESLSLFDSLPNQGALTHSAEQNPSRNTRDSVFTRVSTNPELHQQLSQDFVLDSSAPVASEDLAFFNRDLIPHIRHRVVGPSIVPVITGPTPVASTTFPIISHQYNKGYGNSKYHHTSSKTQYEDSHSSSDGKNYLSATAKSGGPTVIVYAHPHNKGNQDPNSEQGAFPPAPPPDRNTPGKNEIHYHYHLTSSTTQAPYHYESTRRPQDGYSSNRHSQQQYGPPQPPPTTRRPPSNSGGDSYPPSRLNVAGVSLAEELNNKDFNHRTFFTPTSKYQSPDSYSYSGWEPHTTQAPKAHPSLTYEAPSYDQPQPPPSYSYESPPPKSDYGPPPSPPPSYGPPQTPPPPQNDAPLLPAAPAPPTESHQTSISYQTIPVTHQVTEFVQVPTITQTLINHSPAPASPADQSPANDAPPAPSSSYGVPSTGRSLNLQTAQTQSNSRSVDRSSIAEDQLSRLLLSSSPTSRESSLSDLLLLSQGNRGSNDLSLVELQLLAAASRGSGYSSSNNFQTPILQPQRGGRGPFSNSLPVVNSGFRTHRPFGGGNNLNSLSFGNGVRNFGFQGNNFSPQIGGFSNQQVTGTDTASAIHELIREQRLQGALNDLRSRLRDQSRGADRERQNYRNLFYKGALLLSALTLLPTVATPMAAAAAANSASVIPSFMMPLTIGRRKRSVFNTHEIFSLHNTELTPFEKCLEKIKTKFSHQQFIPNRENLTHFHEWLNCSNQLAVYDSLATGNHSYKNIRLAKRNNNHAPTYEIQPTILASGVIRDDLKKYLPIEEILLNSRCIQKYFCINLREIEKMPSDDTLQYSRFSDEIGNNPWATEALEAAKKNMCSRFHCFEDEKYRIPDKLE